MTVRECVRVLWNRRWFVAGSLMVAVALSMVLTNAAQPVFQAHEKLLVGPWRLAVGDAAQGTRINELSLQLLKSYAAVIETRPIAEQAIELGGLPVDPGALAGRIRADTILGTQIIELTYESHDPDLVKPVLDSIAAAFVAQMRDVRSQQGRSSDPAIQVTIVEPAQRPSSPIRPRPVANLAMALFFGLGFGITTAFTVDHLDTSLKNEQDIEAVAGTSVLASIPKMPTKGTGVYLERRVDSINAESFRKLRTAIQFLGIDRPVHALVVSSASACEGKTTIGLNLSASFAQAGLRTVLVEADLRRPRLHTVFPTEAGVGLTDCLVGRISLDHALRPTPIHNLLLLAAGAIPPNPAELLGSQRMGESLSRLRSIADMIVIDAPPLLPVADASVLLRLADGVLIVTRAGHTKRTQLSETLKLVEQMGGGIFGIVLNARPLDASHNLYTYQYDYSAQ